MNAQEERKQDEKYPFYPKKLPEFYDTMKYLAEHQLTVEIDQTSGAQIIIVSKKDS